MLARSRGKATKDEEEGETEGERLISGPPSCARSCCRAEAQLESFPLDEKLCGCSAIGDFFFIFEVHFSQFLVLIGMKKEFRNPEQPLIYLMRFEVMQQ